MSTFRAIRNPIVLAVFRVTLFWWLVATIFDLESYGSLDADLEVVWIRLAFLAGGILLGFCYIALEIWLYRKAQINGTLPGNRRGLYSSLGQPPLLKAPPKQAAAIPPSLPFPQEMPGGFVEAWFERYREQYPAHANLMEALLKVFSHDLTLPATHIEGGHGGRSLMMHSLLVLGLALRLAETWSYTGLRGKSGRTIVALRDPAYKFNPDDPMVAMASFAHDIGKIECYIKNDKGRVVDSKFEHDQVGGRMLGRMEEVWALPDEDRRLLIDVVSFYHRPMDLPLANGGIACDDRTIAILELLIRADGVASRLENGQNEAEAKECDKEQPEEAKGTLWAAFCELLMQSGRINGPSAAIRIGQKNSSETGSALIYLHEASLRKALAQQMGVDEGLQLGDRTYMLTRSLLKVLQEQGVLYQHHDAASFSDSRALFKVDFHNKKGERLATWPATIIIEPGAILPSLANLPDFTSFPTISRATFGNHSAKNKRVDILSAVEDGVGSESLMAIGGGVIDEENAADPSPPATATEDTSTVAPPPAPVRAGPLPPDVLTQPLGDQLAYLIVQQSVPSIDITENTRALRLDLLPQSLEDHLASLETWPTGLERKERNNRNFVIVHLDRLSSSTESVEPLASTPVASSISTEGEDASPPDADTQATPTLPEDAAEDSDAETGDFGDYSEDFDEDEASSEDGEMAVQIDVPDIPAEDEDDDFTDGDASTERPALSQDSSPHDIAPVSQSTKGGNIQGRVKAAEQIIRQKIKSGKIPSKCLDDGGYVVSMRDVLNFNHQWETLPELIMALGESSPIQYIDRGEKKGLWLKPIK